MGSAGTRVRYYYSSRTYYLFISKSLASEFQKVRRVFLFLQFQGVVCSMQLSPASTKLCHPICPQCNLVTWRTIFPQASASLLRLLQVEQSENVSIKIIALRMPLRTSYDSQKPRFVLSERVEIWDSRGLSLHAQAGTASSRGACGRRGTG